MLLQAQLLHYLSNTPHLLINHHLPNLIPSSSMNTSPQITFRVSEAGTGAARPGKSRDGAQDNNNIINITTNTTPPQSHLKPLTSRQNKITQPKTTKFPP